MTNKPTRRRPASPDIETRRRHALRRLGSDHPSCHLCGHDDPCALELHHLAGRTSDDQIVPVCRNCHAALSDAQLDHPPLKPGGERDLEKIGRLLLGLADFFLQLAARLKKFGALLIDLAHSLILRREGQQ